MNKSKVMVYGDCDSTGRRPFLRVVASESTNAGVNHPYGLTIDDVGNLYASFQHTDVVLRFKSDSFHPLALPEAIASRIQNGKLTEEEVYPGTFFAYSFSTYSKKQGIRDIEWVQGYLWVANEDIKGVSIVDSNGYEVEVLQMPNKAKPIGVHYNKDYNLVFISTKAEYGAVYALHPITRKVRIMASYTCILSSYQLSMQ
jgi:nitrogen fixation protein